MDEDGKVQEEAPKNLNALIRDKLKILVNEFDDLCGTLEKLGIPFKSYSETSDSNAFLKGDETTDAKNKVTKKAITCSSSKTSKTIGVSTIDSEILSSSSNSSDETDNGSDASRSDTDIDESSDSGSETSTTAVNLSNSDPDVSSSSSENLESDSKASITIMASPKKDQTELSVVENYSVADSMDCFSEMFTNTVIYKDHNTEIYGASVTSDQAWESLQLEMLSSNNPQETFDSFLSYNSLNTQRTLLSSDRNLDSDQGPYADNSCDNIHESPDIDQEATIMKKESSHVDPALDKDEVISVTDDEGEISDIDEDWEKVMFSENFLEDPRKALNNLVSDSNQKTSNYLESSDGDSESCHSTLRLSDSDVKSCLSGLKSSDRNRETALRLLDLRNLMISSMVSSDLGQRATGTAEKSFDDNSGSVKRRRTSVSSDETMVDKEVTVNLTLAADDDWDSLSLAMKYDRDPWRTYAEFVSSNNQNQSKTSGFSDRDSENRDWKLSESYQELRVGRRSRSLLNRLKARGRSVNKNKLSPSEYSANMHSMQFQKEPIAKECDNQRPSFSSNEATKSHSDTLANIFRTFIKCYPLKKFEIPPYVSTNAERTLDITERKLDGSSTKHKENDMPLCGIDKNRILNEYFSITDSHSVMVFESVDCFSQNSSIMCDALIKEYLNTAIKLKVFLIKKVEDVSAEDFEPRMRILYYLDDELGYLSAKLITTRNEWVRQYTEIKQTLLNNGPSITRSLGLYHIGILRVCTELTAILLNLCLEKQLELEDYEQNMIFNHDCSD